MQVAFFNESIADGFGAGPFKAVRVSGPLVVVELQSADETAPVTVAVYHGADGLWEVTERYARKAGERFKSFSVFAEGTGVSAESSGPPMHDRKQFYDHLRAHPEDDNAWLAYMDFSQQQDGEAAVTSLRAEIERTKDTIRSEDASVRSRAIDSRQRQLFIMWRRCEHDVDAAKRRAERETAAILARPTPCNPRPRPGWWRKDNNPEAAQGVANEGSDKE